LFAERHRIDDDEDDAAEDAGSDEENQRHRLARKHLTQVLWAVPSPVLVGTNHIHSLCENMTFFGQRMTER